MERSTGGISSLDNNLQNVVGHGSSYALKVFLDFGRFWYAVSAEMVASVSSTSGSGTARSCTGVQ